MASLGGISWKNWQWPRGEAGRGRHCPSGSISGSNLCQGFTSIVQLFITTGLQDRRCICLRCKAEDACFKWLLHDIPKVMLLLSGRSGISEHMQSLCLNHYEMLFCLWYWCRMYFTFYYCESCATFIIFSEQKIFPKSQHQVIVVQESKPAHLAPQCVLVWQTSYLKHRCICVLEFIMNKLFPMNCL